MPRLRLRPAFAATTVAFALVGLGATSACLERPIAPLDPRTTANFTEAYPYTKVDKIDLLFAIDDSASMGDKQDLLAHAVPDLVDQLVNPACIDANGAWVAQPPSNAQACPAGSAREFTPVSDIHIGIVSSDLGARGTGQCAAKPDGDAAHLIEVAGVDTWDGLGFLVWDPEQQAEPVGVATSAELTSALGQMVRGVGETGCGYEASLESWYRFLVDPEPYAKFDEAGKPSGVDQTLLDRRSAFLRPDSMVAIVMLTDENDCSLRMDGTHLADNPAGSVGIYCLQHPDMLYPVERYVTALTSDTVPNRSGELVPNPLFFGQKDGVSYRRPSDRVYLAGIVGVPWQDIARKDGNGVPSLTAGLMSASELSEQAAWDVILGDPARGIAPSDPHMIESVTPRPGLAPTTAGTMADPIHGHEWNAGEAHSMSLQYACVFDLRPEDWLGDEPGESAPDCNPVNADPSELQNPLCQDETGAYTSVQRRAKAFPGLRHLQVLRGIGPRAIVGSICPAEIDDEGAKDYGYRPAIAALSERLKDGLKDPCLPRSLTPKPDGQVDCVILEARHGSSSCDCSGTARAPVANAHLSAVEAAAALPASQANDYDCYCEVTQLAGEALDACQNVNSPSVTTSDDAPVDGWCYVDATAEAAVGNPELVEHCAATEQRTIRFLGEGAVQPGATLFITCHQEID